MTVVSTYAFIELESLAFIIPSGLSHVGADGQELGDLVQRPRPHRPDPSVRAATARERQGRE